MVVMRLEGLRGVLDTSRVRWWLTNHCIDKPGTNRRIEREREIRSKLKLTLFMHIWCFIV